MTAIGIVDTTLRDGHQSLWAIKMTTAHMLPAMPDLDTAGFDGMEFTVPQTTFPRALKELHEDPWDWIRLGTQLARNTDLRLHGGPRSLFVAMPSSLESLLLRLLGGYGIRTTRVSDYWNNFPRLAPVLQMLSDHGFRSVVNIVYSVSPRHTVDYYAERTRQAAALRPYRLCFKDVGGLLTPETAAEFMPVIVENAGGIPIEFHAHSNNGMAPYVALMAAEFGIRYIHTAVPPLANGSSQPSVFTVVRNLRRRGFEVDVDLERLERVSEHFALVAEREGLPVGRPAEFDESLYGHQLPGGMVSNFGYHLGQVGARHRMQEVLDETVAVRRELGYPIMITPFAQFVGTQAALNVLTGERYRAVSDEVIRYAMGQFGEEATVEMDPVVRETVLSRQRAVELVEPPPEDVPLETVRAEFGGDFSDEELLVRVLTGMRDGTLDYSASRDGYPRTYEEYRACDGSLLDLLKKLDRARGDGHFSLSLPGLTAAGM
ncbi:MAG: biotin carboxyl carrier protein [Propionibacteriales bacterium]|nr:biotin carboxyl carrier protein [Propionibacteriales bacterium]MQB02084.1 biotin carboxyl carrier protein [Actinomycetota bacterium]